jgi:hypothetical protein
MGEQRRFEEVSHLIDELERYDCRPGPPQTEDQKVVDSIDALKQEVSKAGPKLLPDDKFKVLSEAPRSELGRPVTYTREIYGEKQEVRFYEAYYADVSAGGMPPLSVLWWLLKLGLMPIRVLLTRWRGRMRLHKATLFGLRTALKNRNDNDYCELIERYDAFENLDARREYPKGRFWNFWYFLQHGTPEDRKNCSHLRKLAVQWWLRFVWTQLWIMFLILSLIAGLLLLGVYGIPALVQYFRSLPVPLPQILLTLLAGLGLLLLYGANYFLRSFLSDVYFWTTYQETSEKSQKRRAILNRCADYISHVIADDKCRRVVLVGHSLGTTVLHDTLFDLAARAGVGMQRGLKRDLKKIQHIVTLASPVDKIHYLFESTFSESHRFNEVIEETRGDLSKPPFSSEDGQRRIHWINIWNQADVVSSRLYTPVGLSTLAGQKRLLEVYNFEVALDYFPEPATAHTEYFKNKFVLEIIYSILLKDPHEFSMLYKKVESEQPAVDSFPEIGRFGKGEAFNAIFQTLIIVLPWLSLLNHGIQKGLLAVSQELSLFPYQSDASVIIAGVFVFILYRLLKRKYPSIL